MAAQEAHGVRSKHVLPLVEEGGAPHAKALIYVNSGSSGGQGAADAGDVLSRTVVIHNFTGEQQHVHREDVNAWRQKDTPKIAGQPVPTAGFYTSEDSSTYTKALSTNHMACLTFDKKLVIPPLPRTVSIMKGAEHYRVENPRYNAGGAGSDDDDDDDDAAKQPRFVTAKGRPKPPSVQTPFKNKQSCAVGRGLVVSLHRALEMYFFKEAPFFEDPEVSKERIEYLRKKHDDQAAPVGAIPDPGGAPAFSPFDHSEDEEGIIGIEAPEFRRVINSLIERSIGVRLSLLPTAAIFGDDDDLDDESPKEIPIFDNATDAEDNLVMVDLGSIAPTPLFYFNSVLFRHYRFEYKNLLDGVFGFALGCFSAGRGRSGSTRRRRRC